MAVANPKRILAVSLETQADQLRRIVEDVTSNALDATAPSLAGLMHSWALETAYYTATVPVWLDLIAAPADWAELFLSDEARDVLAALGGFVLVFALPAAAASADELRSLIRHIGRVVHEGLGGWEWDGVRLAVGVGDAPADEWDDACAEAGLEFVHVVDGQPPGPGQYREKTGLARVKEAIEANDWAQNGGPSLLPYTAFQSGSDGGPSADDATDPDPDAENLDFGLAAADAEELRRAIWVVEQQEAPAQLGGSRSRSTADGDEESAGDDDAVLRVEQMMRKLQAARDAGAGLSESQRRALAARAVAQVMREL